MTKALLRQIFLIALVIGSGVLVFYILAPFLAPIALGIIFAVLLHPLYLKICDAIGGQETLGSLLTVLFCGLVLLIPVGYLGFQLIQEAQGIYMNIAGGGLQTVQLQFLQRVEPWLTAYIPDALPWLLQSMQDISSYTQQGIVWLMQHMGVAFSGISSFFLQTFIFLMTLYYLLRDGGRLKRVIIENSPLSREDDEMVFAELGRSVNSVVKGKLLIAIIQGIFAGIGLAVFGVPNSIFWGLVATLFSLIPPFGTAFVLAPAVLYLFAIGTIPAAIGLAIWSGIAGLIDNVLGPKLMTSGTQFHPLLMLVSVLGGLAFFGPVGLFLGPIAVSFFLTLLSLYRHFLEGAPMPVSESTP
ncbi:AI-2E family transporter [Candidatus Parcubacteria bacterium]|nr:MAG: AI-2E family transporter [Candidatus Parcubacteria bacterium]